MNDHPFQVGDKVVLKGPTGRLTIVPQLVEQRVYCVSAVSFMESDWLGCNARACLVGVRRHRAHASPKAGDALPAVYFRRVGASQESSHDGEEVG